MIFSQQKLSPKNCKIAIFLGGITNEINISLDSARTFYDSIRYQIDAKNIHLIFIDKKINFYIMEHEWIYSNHYEDFNQVFLKNQKPLPLDSPKFENLMAECHAFLPFVHGLYGEDGKLTKLLESFNRKSILGSSPLVLKRTLNKNKTYSILKKNNFLVPEHALIDYKKWQKNPQVENLNFLKKKWIVKPNDGGSSDGVFLTSPKTFLDDIKKTSAFSKNILLEEYIAGREFSLILLEDEKNNPLPLVPTEIQFKNKKQNIYTRTKKYLPGSGAFHITPPTFQVNTIKKIIDQAKKIYRLFGFSDWVRLDGFVNQQEEIIWSDFNGIPGFGQDSYIFQQSSLLSFNTKDVSLYLLKKALKKENYFLTSSKKTTKVKKVIGVIGGGETSERQISRMSWFNVIEKLEYLNTYKIKYFFLDKTKTIWEVTKFIALKHTIDEIETIIDNVTTYQKKIEEINHSNFLSARLQEDCLKIKKITLKKLKGSVDFFFIALHGGVGENGTLQSELEKLKIPFNGSSSAVSKICSDKKITNDLLQKLKIKNFISPAQITFSLKEIQHFFFEHKELSFSKFEKSKTFFALKNFFEKKINQRQNDFIEKWVLKPRSDGCSTGIIILSNFYYQIYLYFFSLLNGRECISYQTIYQANHFSYEQVLQLPVLEKGNMNFLLEEYISPKNTIELTVGVLENKNQKIISLLPSKTIAQDNVLSLDEKFNKGLGINLTPPPELDNKMIKAIQKRISLFSEKIGLRGYARIDVFYNYQNDKLYLIEVNNLPGLTAATIIYTQAMLTSKVRLKPTDFLDKIISLGFKKQVNKNA